MCKFMFYLKELGIGIIIDIVGYLWKKDYSSLQSLDPHSMKQS